MRGVIEFLKIIADDTRLKIILMLSQRDMCVCEIMQELGMSQPAVSHHLRVLKKEKIVSDDKDGRWVFYSLNEDKFLQEAEKVNTNLFKLVRDNLQHRITARNYDFCRKFDQEHNL